MKRQYVADDLEIWCKMDGNILANKYVIMLSGDSDDCLKIGAGETIEEARKSAIKVLRNLLKDAEKVKY